MPDTSTMPVAGPATRAESDMTPQHKQTPPAVVVHTGPGYATGMDIRHHHLVADEPVDKGGTDTGPTPAELMAAALGSCTSITMRMYADRKEWTVGDIDVSVWHRRTDEKDPSVPGARPRRIDIFDLAISVAGPLTADQRERLVEIASRCPVKRALDGNSRIVTRLVD